MRHGEVVCETSWTCDVRYARALEAHRAAGPDCALLHADQRLSVEEIEPIHLAE